MVYVGGLGKWGLPHKAYQVWLSFLVGKTVKGGGNKYIFRFCIMLYLFHLKFKDAALNEKASGGAVLSFYGSGQPFH